MPGLIQSNELIARDEGMHTDFAALLFEYIVDKPSQETVHAIIREAVAIEKTFITKAIPCALIGMNDVKMSAYIEFVADRLLNQLGYSRIWNHKKCPFDFMDTQGLDNKSHFFERKVTEYQKAKNKTIRYDVAF